MAYILVDLIDLQTGEVYEELYDRNEAPVFGAEFDYVHNGECRRVARRIAAPQAPIAKEVSCVAYSRPKWDPAFKHHTPRGFGVVTGKRDLERVLDNSKRKAQSESDEWTWDAD